MYVDANNQRKIAEEQTALAKTNETLANDRKNEALSSQSRLLADAAIREANNGDAVTGALIALEALPKESESGSDASRPYVSEAEAAALLSLHQMRERTVLRAHSGSVENIAVSKDGSYFSSVSADGVAIRQGWDARSRSIRMGASSLRWTAKIDYGSGTCIRERHHRYP